MMDDEYDRSSPFFFCGVCVYCYSYALHSPLPPFPDSFSFFSVCGLWFSLFCGVVWCGVVWVVQSLN